MLSYQHQYHAGNFADIHKHLGLIATLMLLHKKDKPISVIDTHAGNGHYDVTDNAAQQTQEAQHGIQSLWQHLSGKKTSDNSINNETLETYLQIIRQLNNPNNAETLHYYPGSPAIALALAREQDNWTGFELHPQAHQKLSQNLRTCTKQHQIHQRDAFEGLLATLPQTHPRTAIIMDPSYEIKADYDEIPKIIRKTLQTKRQSIILLWYPILTANRHERMIRTLSDALQPDQTRLISEWQPNNTAVQDSIGMKGSGLAIINPPWQLDEALSAIAKILSTQPTFRDLVYQQR